jgi:beta-lactamase regulating signal transducer with metallopeptidase domain/predicted  nucleic acid-binding Zn-ribbon protein
MMLAHLEFWILEAAFRSLLMAVAVWAVIRVMRVEAVLAQKVAWVMVLVAAGTMPLVMRAPWLTLNNALRIPIRAPRPVNPVSPPTAPSVTAQTAVSSPAPETVSTLRFAADARPARKHRASRAVVFLSRSPRSSQSGAKITHLPSETSISAPQSIQVKQPLKPAVSQNSASAPANSTLWSWAQIKPVLTMLYLAGGAILLLRLLAGLSVAFRIWRRSEPIANFSEETLPALGNRVLRARASRDLATPVTIGSTVILPADYAEWDPAKLRIVLAHEHSHVRQGDFYLQSLAAFHVAIFWFSPLGWWLQRKLSELGEALSDRAGLEQAKDPASYAQVLLEFAALPRTSPFAGALTGVAMARSSNLSSRIERILNARRFRLAFLGGRRHAILAATLVPAALVAVVACIRIVPAVEAAQNPPGGGQLTGVVAPAPFAKQIPGPLAGTGLNGKAPGAVTGVVSGQVSGHVSGEVSGEIPNDQVMTMEVGQTAPPAPAVAPVAPNPPSPDVVHVQAPEPPAEPEANEDVAPVPPKAPRHGHNVNTYSYSDDGEDSFAIVRDGGNSTISINGHSKSDLEKAREKYHRNFIWFEHDGKSYVITDPAILAQSEAMFKGDDALNARMAELNGKQDALNKKMEALQPEMDHARLPGPEFEAQMAKLRQQLAFLQSDEYKKLTESIARQAAESQKTLNTEALQEAQEKLGNLQEKIGDIQGQIGEIQGKIGERQGEIGEKQGELGEQMGRLGEEMGRIGEEQGRKAEEAVRKMRSVFDQAIKDGKAQPVQ